MPCPQSTPRTRLAISALNRLSSLGSANPRQAGSSPRPSVKVSASRNNPSMGSDMVKASGAAADHDPPSSTYTAAIAALKAAGPRITTRYQCQPTRQRSSRRNSCLTAVRPPVRAAASTAAAAAIHVQSRPMAPNSTPIARGIHTAQVNAKASRKKTTSRLRRTNSNVPYLALGSSPDRRP